MASLMTVEYYGGEGHDRLIGAVYVPEASALWAAKVIGGSILQATGGKLLQADILDRDGNLKDTLTVFRRKGKTG